MKRGGPAAACASEAASAADNSVVATSRADDAKRCRERDSRECGDMSSLPSVMGGRARPSHRGLENHLTAWPGGMARGRKSVLLLVVVRTWERMGSGGLRGLQIPRSGAIRVRGGFDSHAFPPSLARRLPALA